MRLGLIIDIGKDPDAAFQGSTNLAMPTAQIFVDEFEMERRPAAPSRSISTRSRLHRSWWADREGSVDFYEGPLTIGLVPTPDAHSTHCADQESPQISPSGAVYCGSDERLRIHSRKSQRSGVRETVAAIREVAHIASEMARISAMRPVRRLPSRWFARWAMWASTIRASISISRI